MGNHGAAGVSQNAGVQVVLVNCSNQEFFILQKYLFELFQSLSCLMGVTVAVLRQNLSNMNMIFNG